jgi:predicted RNA-binding protein associated with RNAse of E/G family
VKEVRDARGALKGWYCDVTRPATRLGVEVVVEDLDLDLWRSADGRDIRRLDEDEFAASGLAERDPEAAAAALAALDELEVLAREDGFGALLT